MIDTSFQVAVNSQSRTQRIYSTKNRKKDYNIIINDQNVSYQLGPNDIKIYEDIQKTIIGDGDCHTNG